MEQMRMQTETVMKLVREQMEAQVERAREDAVERQERADAEAERREAAEANKPKPKPADSDDLRDLKKELNYASLTAADNTAVKHDMCGQSIELS